MMAIGANPPPMDVGTSNCNTSSSPNAPRPGDPFPVLHLWQRLLPHVTIVLVSAVALSALGTLIDLNASSTPSMAQAVGSTAASCPRAHAPPGVQGALLAAHLVSLPLLASSMYVWQEKHEALVGAGARGQRLLPQLAFAAMMVGVAAEVSWHASQGWVYIDTTDMLNWLFYQGLMSGLALLAYASRAPTPRPMCSATSPASMGALTTQHRPGPCTDLAPAPVPATGPDLAPAPVPATGPDLAPAPVPATAINPSAPTNSPRPSPHINRPMRASARGPVARSLEGRRLHSLVPLLPALGSTTAASSQQWAYANPASLQRAVGTDVGHHLLNADPAAQAVGDHGRKCFYRGPLGLWDQRTDPFSLKWPDDVTDTQQKHNSQENKQGHSRWRDYVTDAFLLASVPAVPLLYLGAETCLRTKLPIHLLLTAVFAVLTARMHRLLRDYRVWLFPAFGVGVNLAFIVLLRAHAGSPVLNPLFHICHDVFGTEMGVAILASLVWTLLPGDADTEKEEGGCTARLSRA